MMENTTKNAGTTTTMMMDYMKNNPLLFAVVVFPTATMGLLLLVKPKLRPKFMGGGGTENGNFLGGSSSSYNIPNEIPVYENATADDIMIEEKNKTEKKIRAREEEEEAVVATTMANNNTSNDAAAAARRRGNSIVCDDEAVGTNEVRERVTKEVIDLFSAIGIRPHPGGGGAG